MNIEERIITCRLLEKMQLQKEYSEKLGLYQQFMGWDSKKLLENDRERRENNMFGFLFGLGILTFVLWIGFKLTGALLSACLWLFLSVPLGFGFLGIGLVLCCTIILIPIGKWFLKTGLKLVIPGI